MIGSPSEEVYLFLPPTLLNSGFMSLRAWTVRSKSCYSVPGWSSPSGRAGKQALVLRFYRASASSGYATSSNTSSDKTAPLRDAAGLSNKNTLDDATLKQAHQQALKDQTASSDKSEDPPSPVLRENIYTIPNLLTVSRIISCPFLGYFIVNGNFVAATSLLFYAGVSDLVGTETRCPFVRSLCIAGREHCLD